MTDPLETTFQVLTSTKNIFAGDVLISALDVRDDRVRNAAAQALIARNATRGHVEIIRRMPQLPDELRRLAEAHIQTMGRALRQCLIHGDDELKLHALQLVRETQYFGQLSTLMEMLKAAADAPTAEVAETVRALVDALYEKLQSQGPTGRRHRPAAEGQLLSAALTSLDDACARFETIAHADDVVRSILILGDPESFAVKRALWQAAPSCRALAGELLLDCKHPGVMQLVCEFFALEYPHPKALAAVKHRDDHEFIAHLLKWFPSRLTATQAKNFKQIDAVAWLEPNRGAVARIPEELQPAVIRFASATGIPSEHKTFLRDWMVKHGGADGRMAAGDALLATNDDSARTVVLSSLFADDESVQAWATSQLRSQGIPEAFKLLIERVDSPLSEVREAAREELASFDLFRMLDLFEHLPHEVCLKCGELLLKVDEECATKLLKEMGSPIRRHRIRAARAALALGLRQEALPGLTAMLDDSDAHVRRTAVEALSGMRDASVVRLLQGCLEDSSPRVRDAATRALREIQSAETTAEDEVALSEAAAGYGPSYL